MKNRHPRNNNDNDNIIYAAWRHFGCNLPPDMFGSIFRSMWLTWQMNRAKKRICKTMTPRQLKFFEQRCRELEKSSQCGNG